MKSAAFATLLLCSILAGRAATADALTISIAQLQALNAPNLFQIANQGFSQAGFQTTTRALATLIQVLQAITLPYLANQVVNLNGSLQTLANLVGAFNSTLTGVNITLNQEIGLHEAQDTQTFQMLGSQLSQLNNTSSQLVSNLSSLASQEANDTLNVNNRVDQLNSSIAPLLSPGLNQTILQVLNGTGINQTLNQVQEQVNGINELLVNASGVFNGSYANITNTLQEHGAAIAALNGSVGNLSNRLTNDESAIAGLNQSLTNLSNSLDGLAASTQIAVDNLTNSVGNLTQNVSNLNDSINNLNGSLNNLKNYVDTNILGNISAIPVPNVSALQSQIAGNASALQAQFINSLTGLNASIQTQLGNLDNKIAQSNASLTTAIGNAINYLENMILANASAINSSIAQTALDASNALSAAVNNIDSQLNLLFLNDSITLYANNTQTAGLFTMFSWSQLVDNSGIPVSASESDYIIAFSNPHFDNPPLVALSLTYTGSGVPQRVSLVLSNLSSNSVTVRVITIDGSALDTSGKLGFHLIAYGV